MGLTSKVSSLLVNLLPILLEVPLLVNLLGLSWPLAPFWCYNHHRHHPGDRVRVREASIGDELDRTQSRTACYRAQLSHGCGLWSLSQLWFWGLWPSTILRFLCFQIVGLTLPLKLTRTAKEESGLEDHRIWKVLGWVQSEFSSPRLVSPSIAPPTVVLKKHWIQVQHLEAVRRLKEEGRRLQRTVDIFIFLSTF